MSYLNDHSKYIIQLWNEGLSYKQIALTIGNNVTVNAVAGFCFRLGLKRRPNGEDPQKRKAAGARARAKRQLFGNVPKEFTKPSKQVYQSEKMDLEIPKEQRKTLSELNGKQCHWPVGDPKKENFFYCGGDSQVGSMYCEDHSRRAHKPSNYRAPHGHGVAYRPRAISVKG